MRNLLSRVHRFARLVKRGGRLVAGRDVLYRYDVRPPKAHLGSVYGGWTLIPGELKTDGIAYSFGVGSDISFDLELIERFGLRVHGFDPSPQSIEWLAAQEPNERYQFHAYGLGSKDGLEAFFTPSKGGMYTLRKGLMNASDTKIELPVKRLSTIVASLGTRCIDVLKIDIEGAEYGVLGDLIKCPVPIRQLLLEFHHRAGIESLPKTIESVELLKSSGFRLFHVSETSSEFSFLHA